jgi:hypothetical protein
MSLRDAASDLERPLSTAFQRWGKGTGSVPDTSLAEDSPPSRSSQPQTFACFAEKSRCCRVSAFGCFTCAWAVAALLCAVGLVGFLVVGPHMAQVNVQHSTLSLQKCTMHHPNMLSIRLDCHVRLDNAGGISATLHAFPVDVLHLSDTKMDPASSPELFGSMMMPKTDVKAHEPTFIHLTSVLNVSNNAAFTRATAGVMQGNVGTWIVRGRATLEANLAGLSVTYSVELEKEMLLPPTLLSDVTADGFVITGTDENHIYALASSSLLSVSVLELHSLGAMSFSLHSVDPSDPENATVSIGEITIPDFQVRRGFNEYHNVTVKLMIDENATMHGAAYNASARAVKGLLEDYARGSVIHAKIKGPTWIESGSPFLLGLVEQDIVINNNGPLIEGMQTSDIQIMEGTKNTLPATARGTFHSASTIQAGALGMVTFALQTFTKSSSSSSSPEEGAQVTTIGTVTMPSTFGLHPGENSVLAAVTITKDGTAHTNTMIESFVNEYVHGNDQPMQLWGPINHPTTMMNGFLTLNITAGGMPSPNVVVGSILTKSSIHGYKSDGVPPVRATDGLIRGAVAIASNPFDASIRMSDVNYDIFLHDPIEYTLTNEIWTEGKTLHCPRSDKFSRSSFGEGMHMYPYLCPKEDCDPSHAAVSYVDFAPNQQRSFLSPAYPMPGQTLYKPGDRTSVAKCPSIASRLMPDWDCCYLSLFFASACRALEQGDAHFLARTNGTMRLSVGKFELNTAMSQDALSFTFEAALLDGWKMLGITEVPTCKDFKFL